MKHLVRHHNDQRDQDKHEVDLQHLSDKVGLLVEDIGFQLLRHDHVDNHSVWCRQSLQDRIGGEVLQVTETIVMVLHVVVDFDVIGGWSRIHLLGWDAGLDLGPLVIEEEFKLVLVAKRVLVYTESEAQPRLVFIMAISRLGHVCIDSLFVIESFKDKEIAKTI